MLVRAFVRAIAFTRRNRNSRQLSTVICVRRCRTIIHANANKLHAHHFVSKTNFSTNSRSRIFFSKYNLTRQEKNIVCKRFFSFRPVHTLYPGHLARFIPSRAAKSSSIHPFILSTNRSVRSNEDRARRPASLLLFIRSAVDAREPPLLLLSAIA